MELRTLLTRGMDLDSHPRHQPEGTWREALNVTVANTEHRGFGLTNEQRVVAVMQESMGKAVGYHRLEELNQTVFFHYKGGASTISIFHHDTLEFEEVAKDSDYNCDWHFDDCKWVGHGHSTSKPLAPCNETILYWSSGFEYWALNLEVAKDPERRKDLTCEDIKLIPCRSQPTVRVKRNRGGGQDLAPGPYFAAARAVDAHGNRTNWSFIEGPVFLRSKTNNPAIEDPSFESLRIEVNTLAKDYHGVEIAVIPPSGESAGATGEIIYSGAYNTNGVSVDYYSHSQHIAPISLSDIVDKDNKKVLGCSLMQANGILNLYQTLQRPNINYQPKALKAKVRYTVGAVPGHMAEHVYSLPHDEPVPVGIQWKLCDGTYTPVYPIVFDGAAADNAFDCGCDVPPGHLSNNARRTHTYKTYDEVLETYCMTGAVQTTEREGDTPESKCEDAGVEPRSTEDVDPCVSDETYKAELQGAADAIQNTPETVADCIDCNEGPNLNDLQKIRDVIVRSLEKVASLFKTEDEAADDCEIGKTSSIKEAAKRVYEEGVQFADKDEEFTQRPVFEKNVVAATSGGDGSAPAPPAAPSTPADAGAAPQGVKSRNDDCTFDYQPELIGKGSPGYWESTKFYPKTKDCDGNYLYGDFAGQPIRWPKMPAFADEPMYISTQNGVESRFEPHNKPDGNTVVFVLGLEVYDIEPLVVEDLPRGLTLDENEPFRVVIGERTPHNRSTVGMGYLTHTFKGVVNNTEFAVPNHAVNAFPKIDRNIDNDGSRKGEAWAEPLYNLHMPEMCMAETVPTADYLKIEAEIYGSGRRYQLYAEGKDPERDDRGRMDRRGCRSAANLNHYRVRKEQYVCVKGMTHAEADKNLQNPGDVSKPLLNKYRESSIYLETEEAVPELSGGNDDKSFVGDGLEHEAPIFEAKAWLVTLKRLNNCQYGNVENMSWVPIGRGGRSADQGSIIVWGGDVKVQKWSHRRMSYVSDCVGNAINEDFPVTATSEFLGDPDNKPRSVCDPPNRRGYAMKEFLGFWNPRRLPESGDKKDPKNMSNLHPTLGAAEAAAATDITAEMFYPRMLSHLNHTWVQSAIALDGRITGEPELREVYYEDLKGLDLDSSINGRDPEESWLNDFHCHHLQPSQTQQNRKAKIRTFIVMGIPFIAAGGVAATDSALSLGLKGLLTPAFVVFWMALVYNILTTKKLDKLLGIPPCKTDDEGAKEEDCARGFLDNYCQYSWAFSALNNLNTFITMPDPFNVCRCDVGDNPKLSNVIFSSNRQIPASFFDAFRNFESNSYSGIDAEKGIIQKMLVWQNQLWGITTDSWLALQHREVRIPSTAGLAFAGQGQLIGHPIAIMDGSFSGFAGTEDPNAIIITPHGVFNVDSEGRKLYRFTSKMDEISGEKYKISRWLRRYLGFCEDVSCRDQMQADGSHYTMGYDPKLERLLFTKKDGDKSFTLSFDLASEGHWISYHSYTPDFYFWDRDRLFSVRDGVIYRHNEHGGFAAYGAEKFPVYATLINRRPDLKAFRTISALLDTQVNEFGGAHVNVRGRDLTFNKAMFWNDFQNTGWMTVDPRCVDDIRAAEDPRDVLPLTREEFLLWSMNNIKDAVVDVKQPHLLISDCSYGQTLNASNIQCNHDDDSLIGQYLASKWVWEDNTRQINVFGFDVQAQTLEEERKNVE